MNLMKKTASRNSDKKQPTSDGTCQVISIKMEVQAKQRGFFLLLYRPNISVILASLREYLPAGVCEATKAQTSLCICSLISALVICISESIVCKPALGENSFF